MFTATYSPDDNKLRLYASSRLDNETYARAKAAGFRWAPKQDLFFATWNPGAEDIALELAGEIDDEDTSLVERAEERADRFGEYRSNRLSDAEGARKAVAAIADNIPLGQPILVGHHSERHARKDAERIESGMRKAVKMWETAEYWKSRATGAIRHAKYKELPSVRARRIKTIEAALRKEQKQTKESEQYLRHWRNLSLVHRKDGTPMTDRQKAMALSDYDHISRCFPLGDYPRDPPASQYEGPMGLWSALEGDIITAEQAQALAIPAHERTIARCARWIAHYENRLAYERAMLGDAGGTVADKTGPEKGGAVKCWAAPGNGRGWAFVQKVNKVSVSVLDNWGNGGRNFLRTIEFDKLTAVMTKAEVETAKSDGRLREDALKTGFFLLDAPPAPRPEPEMPVDAKPFEEMRQRLKAGIKVVSAPQLFPTPAAIVDKVVAAAGIEAGHRVLEPSAGTGAMLGLILDAGADVVAVEIRQDLAAALQRFPTVEVYQENFLACESERLGTFDRIVMNPPFAGEQDIRHVMHAAKFLKPSGRLVAIMSAGVTFRQDRLARDFRAMVEERGGVIEPLPEDAFKASGTGVNTVLVTLDA